MLSSNWRKECALAIFARRILGNERVSRVCNHTRQENQALFERLGIIEEQIAKYQDQLDRLLDLYLDGEFPKEVLTERKASLEDLLVNLGKEHDDLMGHVWHVTMTDDQLSYIEEFCAKIRVGLENADYKTKRQIIELLDICGKVAFENEKKVLYLKCLINPKEQLPRLPMQISPSSSLHWQNSLELTARLVVREIFLFFRFYCAPKSRYTFENF